MLNPYQHMKSARSIPAFNASLPRAFQTSPLSAVAVAVTRVVAPRRRPGVSRRPAPERIARCVPFVIFTASASPRVASTTTVAREMRLSMPAAAAGRHPALFCVTLPVVRVVAHRAIAAAFGVVIAVDIVGTCRNV